MKIWTGEGHEKPFPR